MRMFEVMQKGGVATRLTGNDTAGGQSFSAGLLTANGRSMSAVVVQCDPGQSNAMRVTWGGTAPTIALGIYMAPGDIIRISGEFNCASFRYINASVGNNSVLQMIPEY